MYPEAGIIIFLVAGGWVIIPFSILVLYCWGTSLQIYIERFIKEVSSDHEGKGWALFLGSLLTSLMISTTALSFATAMIFAYFHGFWYGITIFALSFFLLFIPFAIIWSLSHLVKNRIAYACWQLGSVLSFVITTPAAFAVAFLVKKYI